MARVLVCFLEKHVSNLLIKKLEDQGHEVVQANSTHEILNRLLSEAFDILILNEKGNHSDSMNLRKQVESEPSLSKLRVLNLDSNNNLLQ